MQKNSPAACALAALALACTFAFVLLSKRGFDPGRLVIAGDLYCDPQQVSSPVERNSGGYDGQFYYRLALDPFTNRWSDYGIRLDVPTYRQQRIFFPFLAWALSLGNAFAVPAVFVLINIGAVALLAWSSASLLRDAGINAWWSAAVWMYPGWIVSMTRDCAEIVEVALLATTLLAVRRAKSRWSVLAAILATCAALTKETALLAIVVFAFSVPAVAVAALAHIALKLSLFRVWHAPPSLGAGRFSIPFAGLVHSFSVPHLFPVLTTIEIAALFLLAILAFASARRVPLTLVVAFTAYILLITPLDEAFWIDDWWFLRATSEFWVLGGLIVAWARRPAGLVVTAATWLIVAAHVLFVR